MSSPRPPAQRRRLDDPAWVDDIVASAASRSSRLHTNDTAPVPPPTVDDVPSGGTGAGQVIDLREPALADPDAPSTGPVRRRTRYAHRSKREWSVVVVLAIGAVGLLRGFVLETQVAAGDAMAPTVAEGDRVLVSRASFRLGDVDRGDLVVFDDPRAPEGGSPDLIRRVVGLPGETVAIQESGVVIDGDPLDESSIVPPWFTYAATETVTVPEGHVYVLSDNRSRAADSRRFGPVPIADLDGRALVGVWPPRQLAP